MYCAKCGSQLVASANYCHVCGTKVGGAQAQAPRSATPVYEVCEIKWIMTKSGGLFGLPTWQWIAEANGPKGKYNVAVSAEFKAPSWIHSGNGPDHHDAETKAAMDRVVADLLSTGWEPISMGDSGRERPSFRRQAT